MVIHIVRFRSALSDEHITELFHIRAPEYLAIPGLVQKYYLRFRSGEYGGVYVWDSAASMERFMGGEAQLARSATSTAWRSRCATSPTSSSRCEPRTRLPCRPDP